MTATPCSDFSILIMQADQNHNDQELKHAQNTSHEYEKNISKAGTGFNSTVMISNADGALEEGARVP